MGQFIDLIGKRFGKLVVVSQERRENRIHWSCKCDCGNTVTVHGGNLRTGKSKSCGCNRHKPPPNKHGHTETGEYYSWRSMNQRCTNSRLKSYKDYGGRGISVCDRWRSSFLNFLSDMGHRPSLTHTIERNDNAGNYEPGNCRWATRAEQGNNKRNNRLFKYKGKHYTCAQLASKFSIDYFTLRQRLVRYGWDVERSIKTPIRQRYKKFLAQ